MDNSKNAWIGFLASTLIHIIAIALLYIMIVKDKQNRPKIERRALELGHFETEPIREATPVKPFKKSDKTLSQKSSEPIAQSKKEPTKKEKPPKEFVENLDKKAQKKEEQNKSSQEESPRSSQSSLLSALNSEFKATPQKEPLGGGRIKKLYGDEFERMGKEEQKFIKDNLGSIGKITERYLRYPDVSAKLRQQGASVVEFYLYPNGDISDLKLLTTSGYKALDKNSIETIELAYKDYPRPGAKTKIRIYVEYSIY